MYSGDYHKMNDGELCSESYLPIVTESDCEAASQELGLIFAHSWDGPGDFPGCLFANDGRNMVIRRTVINCSGLYFALLSICHLLSVCLL